MEEVEYLHIELETHDVIVADGALSESFVDDDSCGMFHNADEFEELYPDAIRLPARYYAPRLDEGFEVEAVRRRIALRAGLLPARETMRLGELYGAIDIINSGAVAGWAQNVDHPEARGCLDVFVGDRLLGQVLANDYREDLKDAGIGSGCHGFLFALSADLASAPGTIEVQRSLDGAPLEHALARRAAAA